MRLTVEVMQRNMSKVVLKRKVKNLNQLIRRLPMNQRAVRTVVVGTVVRTEVQELLGRKIKKVLRRSNKMMEKAALLILVLVLNMRSNMTIQMRTIRKF